MLVGQRRWSEAAGWTNIAGEWRDDAQLVLAFGARHALESRLDELRRASPNAHVLACSTAGEICDTHVDDDTIAASSIRLEHSRVRAVSVQLEAYPSSHAAGVALARALLPFEDLAHVFVLSDGLRVNGSDLVAGMVETLPANVALTGGLSADGARFEKTLVALDSPATEGTIAAVGLCGSRLRVGYGSMGGWDTFGPERLVTRSIGNLLCELDGRSALELYERYLGEHAADLPASGLLFPLSLRVDDTVGVVRTILSIDRERGTMTFAGNVPEGAYVRLMKANFERLIDGAIGAARRATSALEQSDASLAILISCVGRRLVLKQRVEEELDGVREILGPRPLLTGFYSYGEISPFSPNAKCELHNQTMTITTLGEV